MFEMRPIRNTVRAYNPFREMEALERSFFGEPFRSFGRMADLFRTDISDAGDAYLLETDLPGFAKSDIKLDLDGDTLILHAERHSGAEDEEKKNQYLRCERSFGVYERSFDVSGVDTENIEAKYEDGVLRLRLPKKSEEAPATRNIPIA